MANYLSILKRLFPPYLTFLVILLSGCVHKSTNLFSSIKQGALKFSLSQTAAYCELRWEKEGDAIKSQILSLNPPCEFHLKDNSLDSRSFSGSQVFFINSVKDDYRECSVRRQAIATTKERLVKVLPDVEKIDKCPPKDPLAYADEDFIKAAKIASMMN